MDKLPSLEKLTENPALLEKYLEHVIEVGMVTVATYGLKMVGAVIILIVGWTVSGIVRNAIVKAGKRSTRVDITIFAFMGSVARYIVMAFTIIAMLSSFGVETTSFVAVLGAGGLAVGLALQGALGHVAAGLMLIFFRPFRVGDAVETAGVSGTVDEISLFTTEISTADNVKVIIPNSLIWAANIKNLSTHATRRVVIEVGVSYRANLDEVTKAVRDIIAADKRIKTLPAPVVGVSRLSEAVMTLLVEVWVANAEQRGVRLDLNQRIKDVLDSMGVAGPMAPVRQQSLAPQLLTEQPVPPPPAKT